MDDKTEYKGIVEVKENTTYSYNYKEEGA